MFRCPKCAVSWKLPLTKNHSLLIHKNMDKMSIERNPITIFSHVKTVSLDLVELDKTLNSLGLAFEGYYTGAVPEGMDPKEIDHSPAVICPNCKEHSKLSQWMKAWQYPGDFFEADNLCSCGGELWWDKVPGTSRYALVCDKCEWEKPKARISGHSE